MAVDALPTVRHWYESILGYEGTPIKRDDLQATGARFKIGPHSFEFVKPSTELSPLHDWIKARGPSPYAARLRAKKPAVLDQGLTHGAKLSIE